MEMDGTTKETIELIYWGMMFPEHSDMDPATFREDLPLPAEWDGWRRVARLAPDVPSEFAAHARPLTRPLTPTFVPGGMRLDRAAMARLAADEAAGVVQFGAPASSLLRRANAITKAMTDDDERILTRGGHMVFSDPDLVTIAEPLAHDPAAYRPVDPFGFTLALTSVRKRGADYIEVVGHDYSNDWHELHMILPVALGSEGITLKRGQTARVYSQWRERIRGIEVNGATLFYLTPDEYVSAWMEGTHPQVKAWRVNPLEKALTVN